MKITDATVAVNDAALIPALLAGALALACLVTYLIGSRGQWSRSLLGVAFAGLIVVVLPIFGIIFGRRLFDAYPGYQWVAFFGFSLVAIIYAVLLVVIIITQRRGAAATTEGDPPRGRPRWWHRHTQ